MRYGFYGTFYGKTGYANWSAGWIIILLSNLFLIMSFRIYLKVWNYYGGYWSNGSIFDGFQFRPKIFSSIISIYGIS